VPSRQGTGRTSAAQQLAKPAVSPARPGLPSRGPRRWPPQWLCNADKSHHEPKRRLKRFFETLYSCLVRGGRAVLQVRALPRADPPRRCRRHCPAPSIAQQAGRAGSPCGTSCRSLWPDTHPPCPMQVYPENGSQAEMLVAAAMKVNRSPGTPTRAGPALRTYRALCIGPCSRAQAAAWCC
jgi:hypothetical protein